MPAKTEKKTSQTRTEVLSVKSSVSEKDMILRAAARYKMPYSEFVRMVAIAACRNMGIEEAENVTSEDVRKRRVRRVPVTPSTADAQEPEKVAV